MQKERGILKNLILVARSIEAEDDAEGTAFGKGCPRRGGDAEMTAFEGVLDVETEACADVVVADTDESQRFGSIVGQLGEGDFGWNLVARHILHRHRHVGPDDLIDTTLDLSYLFGRGTLGQLVVEFALLALHMGVARTLAAEHTHHGLVEDMLGGVRRLVFTFVVVVEDGFGHKDVYRLT